MKKLAVLLLALLASSSALAVQGPNKVLVVLSSENKVTLRGGVIHPTGYFLSELMVPVMALKAAGFVPVFADPLGNEPTMDKVSDSPFWFGNNVAKYNEVRIALGGLQGFRHPLTLKEVRSQNLAQYAGIFVPGGHAPMEDLLKNRDLGTILKYFHRAQKPTVLICHGPIALLSTMPHVDEYVEILAKRSQLAAEGQYADAQRLDRELQSYSEGWIYRGYELTAFSSKEEKQEELTGQDKVLGGFMKFYPDEALGFAGAHAIVNAVKWESNVRVDRELITGENPFSDVDLARTFVTALVKQASKSH